MATCNLLARYTNTIVTRPVASHVDLNAYVWRYLACFGIQEHLLYNQVTSRYEHQIFCNKFITKCLDNYQTSCLKLISNISNACLIDIKNLISNYNYQQLLCETTIVLRF